MSIYKMWENIVEIRILARNEYGKSDVLLEILSKEQYENLLIPEQEFDFWIVLNKKNDEWIMSDVSNISDNYISITAKYGNESKDIYVSDKIMKKMVMKGRFCIYLFGKDDYKYNRTKITWEYVKNMKKKMKKIEQKMVDLASEMV